MKKSFVLLAIILAYQVGLSQSFCEGTFPVYNLIEGCSLTVKSEALAFNKMALHLGLSDTIQYACKEQKISYSYKGEAIDDFKYNPKLCGKKLMVRYYKLLHSFQILASIPIGDGKAQIYEVIKPYKGAERVILKAYKEEGVLPYGNYVEKNCAGQILAKGSYKLKKTPSSYAYSWYDDASKEHSPQVIDNAKTSVKHGIWEYYDEKGNLLYTEKYSKRKFKSTATIDTLCSLVQQHIWNYYTIEDKIAPATDLFNAIHAMLGKDRHLSYEISHRGLVYYLNGQLIPNPFFDMQGKYKPWEYQLQNSNNQLLLAYKNGDLNAYIPNSKGSGELIIYKNKTSRHPTTLDVFQTQNHYPDGSFERRDCSGSLLIQGNYSTTNSPRTFRDQQYDKETYKKVWVSTEIDHTTTRSGKWTYYDAEGAELLVEHYPGTTKWAKSPEYLCTNLVDEARAMTKTLTNPFMVSNVMLNLSSIDGWISVEDILDLKSYYLNGVLIDTPEPIVRTNYLNDYRFETQTSTIVIYANTRVQGATSSRKTKLNLNYHISMDQKDGISYEISFSKNKLTLQEYRNGEKEGRYEERQCSGSLLVEGAYCQQDSFNRDTVVTFNPDTYEEVVAVTESNTIAKKQGIWKYYDLNGILEKEEDFGVCR